jgi:hypothetical protein
MDLRQGQNLIEDYLYPDVSLSSTIVVGGSMLQSGKLMALVLVTWNVCSQNWQFDRSPLAWLFAISSSIA